MAGVLASIGPAELLIILVVVLFYAGVIWMIVDIVNRPDFSTGMKAVWVFLGLFFSIFALITYLLFMRDKDFSKK